MSKYSEFHRIPKRVLDDISRYRQYEKRSKHDTISLILNYYQPQFNNIFNNTKDSRQVSEWNIDFSENVYNNHPYVLAVNISNNMVNFHLNEQFSNCGILVSSKTYVSYSNLGFGSLLQCIKEDIAYVFGYSFLSYTDAVWVDRDKFNTKLIINTGAKEIFRGLNHRSSNHIAIWIKDLTEYYTKRSVIELSETLEKKEEKTETVVETKSL